jgi:hypothetical protein
MMSYKILSHWTRSGLESEVQHYLNHGYQLVGSVNVSMTDTYADKGLEPEYVQAVNKPDAGTQL